MPARHATKLWITGVLGLTAVVAGLWAFGLMPSRRQRLATAATSYAENAPLPSLTEGLRESDGRALAVLFQQSNPPANELPKALTETEADEWIAALEAVRGGFPKFGSYGRVSALVVTGRVMRRLAIEPAPASWSRVLVPAHDLLTAGLADADVDVRVTSLVEIGKLWSWSPGRAITSKEEIELAEWKGGTQGEGGLLNPSVRRLGDREAKVRIAAVACFGLLPIDRAAAPAVAYLDDPASPEVRRQVLISFAARRNLLSEDAVLKHMYDSDPGVVGTAELVLQTRGLSREQISLGSMIFHPKPEIRASVIPLLKERADVDPVVWLLQLSRDSDETIRIGAVEALAPRLSPEVGERLAEMASTDKSAEVRRVAAKYLPAAQKTAALPPLPGSSRLNPKAN
jgi:HEAT repeats